MSWKRFAAALGLAFLAGLAFDIFLNGVVLLVSFAKAAEYWLPPEQLDRLVPAGWLARLLVMSLEVDFSFEAAGGGFAAASSATPGSAWPPWWASWE